MPILSSTKIRLTCWYVGVLAIILTLSLGATYFITDSVLHNQIDITLSEMADSFENTAHRELEDEDKKTEIEKIDGAVRDAAVEVSFKNYKIFAFSADKKLSAETKTTELETDIGLETAQKWLDTFTRKVESNRSVYAYDDETFRVHFHPFRIKDRDFYLIAIHPLEETQELLERIRYAFLIIVPLALLLASFGGYLLMRKSFAPIAEMGEKADEITARNLHERLPVEQEHDELGRLALIFNRLLERLNSSFEQQQRFMEDASHELRTPIAIVRGEAEVSLTKKDRPSDDYRETIEIMQKEAERMSRIVEDLFTLARADAGEELFEKSAIYVDDVLDDSIKAFRSVASKRDIKIRLETIEEMPMQGDALLLKRLFANLLDNAIGHTNTLVRVVARIADGNYLISVEDDGQGIPPENQPFIFERFYRVEKERKNEIERLSGTGAGLGLAISKWIASVHGGNLELTKSDSKGTVFTVTIPTP